MVTMLALQFTKPPDFNAMNFVLDLQMDLVDMNDPNVVIKKGPNVELVTKAETNEIAVQIMNLWTDCSDFSNGNVSADALKRFLCVGCCIYMALLGSMIVLMECNLSFFDGKDRVKQTVTISIALSSVIILIFIFCGTLLFIRQRLRFRQKWRDIFVEYLCGEYMMRLKQAYPLLTFSVIYPMFVHSQRMEKMGPAIQSKRDLRRTSNALRGGDEYISSVWCYLRISEGSIVTADTEPIYQSTQPSHDRSDSIDHSRVTGVASTFSLNIEDENSSMVSRKTIQKNSVSKRGNVQAGKFPVLAKKFGYKQLT